MLAAIEGHKDMVRTLLQHQASVVARDQDGCTALYLAASNGNYEAVKILAEQPLADVNVKNKVRYMYGWWWPPPENAPLSCMALQVII